MRRPPPYLPAPLAVDPKWAAHGDGSHLVVMSERLSQIINADDLDRAAKSAKRRSQIMSMVKGKRTSVMQGRHSHANKALPFNSIGGQDDDTVLYANNPHGGGGGKGGDGKQGQAVTRSSRHGLGTLPPISSKAQSGGPPPPTSTSSTPSSSSSSSSLSASNTGGAASVGLNNWFAAPALTEQDESVLDSDSSLSDEEENGIGRWRPANHDYEL